MSSVEIYNKIRKNVNSHLSINYISIKYLKEKHFYELCLEYEIQKKKYYKRWGMSTEIFFKYFPDIDSVFSFKKDIKSYLKEISWSISVSPLNNYQNTIILIIDSEEFDNSLRHFIDIDIKLMKKDYYSIDISGSLLYKIFNVFLNETSSSFGNIVIIDEDIFKRHKYYILCHIQYVHIDIDKYLFNNEDKILLITNLNNSELYPIKITYS